MIGKISFCFIFALLIGLQATPLWASVSAIENLERTEEVPEKEVEAILLNQSLRFKRAQIIVPSGNYLRGIFLTYNSNTKSTTVSSKYPSPSFNLYRVLRS
jgi:hypothetical protein